MDKELGVHVHALMFQPEERRNSPQGPLPRNIGWEWETWIREIVDYVEFRGAFMLRPPNVIRAVDRIGLAAREAGKPFIYQSSRGPRVFHFDGPHPHLAAEMAWVRRHPDVTAYNLYETANFTRLDDSGRFEGSLDVSELVRRNWRDSLT